MIIRDRHMSSEGSAPISSNILAGDLLLMHRIGREVQYRWRRSPNAVESSLDPLVRTVLQLKCGAAPFYGSAETGDIKTRVRQAVHETAVNTGREEVMIAAMQQASQLGDKIAVQERLREIKPLVAKQVRKNMRRDWRFLSLEQMTDEKIAEEADRLATLAIKKRMDEILSAMQWAAATDAVIDLAPFSRSGNFFSALLEFYLNGAVDVDLHEQPNGPVVTAHFPVKVGENGQLACWTEGAINFNRIHSWEESCPKFPVPISRR